MIQPPPPIPSLEEFRNNQNAFEEWNARAREIQRGNVIAVSLLAGSGAIAMLIVAGILLSVALRY